MASTNAGNPMLRSGRDSDDPREAAVAQPSAPALAPAPATVLALQRSAGNHAVGRLLGATARPLGRAGGPLLQRGPIGSIDPGADSFWADLRRETATNVNACAVVHPQLRAASALATRALSGPALSRLETAEATADAGTEGTQPDLKPEDKLVLRSSVIEPLNDVLWMLESMAERDPAMQDIGRAVQRIEPPLAALAGLAPRPGSQAMEAIVDAKEELRIQKLRLETILGGSSLAPVATNWLGALGVVQAVLAELRAQDPHARAIWLLERSVIPSIENAIHDINGPDPDPHKIVRDNDSTSGVILAAADGDLAETQLPLAARHFQDGIDALDAISDGGTGTCVVASMMIGECIDRLWHALLSGDGPPPGRPRPQPEPDKPEPVRPQPEPMPWGPPPGAAPVKPNPWNPSPGGDPHRWY